MTIKTDRGGNAVQASRPALVQNVSVSGSSAQSAAFQTNTSGNVYNADGTIQAANNNTTHVRVVSTTNCWIAFGSNPTAATATGSIYLPAGVPEYFFVMPAEKIAVIQDSASGTLNIAELVA